MNLTRKILEGIHEVELKVTPEFQKPSMVSVIDTITQMLAPLGWVVKGYGEEVPGQKFKWFVHPKVRKILGKSIVVIYDPRTNDPIKAEVVHPANPDVVFEPGPSNIYQKAQELMKEAGV